MKHAAAPLGQAPLEVRRLHDVALLGGIEALPRKRRRLETGQPQLVGLIPQIAERRLVQAAERGPFVFDASLEPIDAARRFLEQFPLDAAPVAEPVVERRQRGSVAPVNRHEAVQNAAALVGHLLEALFGLLEAHAEAAQMLEGRIDLREFGFGRLLVHKQLVPAARA